MSYSTILILVAQKQDCQFGCILVPSCHLTPGTESSHEVSDKPSSRPPNLSRDPVRTLTVPLGNLAKGHPPAVVRIKNRVLLRRSPRDLARTETKKKNPGSLILARFLAKKGDVQRIGSAAIGRFRYSIERSRMIHPIAKRLPHRITHDGRQPAFEGPASLKPKV